MRIIIDATSLLSRSAGVKTYMHYWIRSLQLCSEGDSIRLFPFLGETSALTHESSSVGKLRTAVGTRVVQFANMGWNPILNLVGLATDVFHASQHLRNPPHWTTHLTSTIYDMTCYLMPEVHEAANVAATLLYGEKVLRRSRACIAISEQSKKDAVEILKLPADSIEVIYPGVAQEFFAAKQSDTKATLEKYGLDRPYFLYVGMIEPRKNLDRTLDAYRSVCDSIRKEYDLVIVGPLGWCSEITRKRLLSPEPGVRYLGYIPEADLPYVTKGATAFIFPSLYEGFGLPLVQAMACGVPAITSLDSSLGEVAGTAALLVDPRNTDSIADAMQRMALSPSLQEDLGHRGQLRAASFTWERNALQSLDFFQKVCAL